MSARGRLVAVGAALGSALLLAAAFPPLGWTVLAFVGWVPLVVAQYADGVTGRFARALGALTVGVLFGLLSLSVNPPEVITGIAWALVSAAVGLAAASLAFLFALPAQTPGFHARLRGWGFVWLPAITWTGVEYLRLITTAGHPFGMTATTQIDTAPLRAFLPLAGMWPVATITVATSLAIAGLVLVVAGRLDGLRRPVLLGVGSVAAAWLLGLVIAALPPPEPGVSLTVAAVQLGEHVPEHPQTNPLIARRAYAPLTDVITDLHTPSTDQAARAGAKLVVWPEASGWVDPTDAASAPQIARIARVATRTGAAIVWSYFIRIDADHSRNELVLVRPGGEISAPTTKDHPVWIIGERSITAGLHPVYELEVVRVGLAAGPDGSYTDTLARLASRGAQIVAVPTHDWLAYAPTQLVHLRLRAAEHRLVVVKADWRSGSAIVASDGAVLAATPLDRKVMAAITAPITVTEPGTPYTAAGDWLGVVSLVVAGMTGVGVLAHTRRRPRVTPRESS